MSCIKEKEIDKREAEQVCSRCGHQPAGQQRAGHEHEHHEHEHENEHEHGHEHKHKHHCECCAHDDDDDEEEETSLAKILISLILFALAIVIEKTSLLKGLLSSLNVSADIAKIVYLALYCASYLLSGLTVLKGAVKSLVKGRVFGEEFLMGIATVGAILMGEYSEAVAVMILFQIGEFFEDKAVDSSRESITSLMDIRPDSATVKRDGKSEVVKAEEVRAGEIIEVRAGERIALDGEVVSGSSTLDTAALTGESKPLAVEAGSKVLSGFVNLSGALEVKVEKEYSESTVARILAQVEKAADKKASSERFVSRFAKIYTPIVCALALLIAFVPPLLFGADFKTWAYRALELLVVSCPCALVISVPLSFFAGIGVASRKGILVKGSSYIEQLSKANTVVFDKTGTLTKGSFEVTRIENADGIEKDELLALATHAEYFSNHPISRSLKAAHSCPECEKLTAENSEEISGHGMKCTLSGKTVLAGNTRLMEKESVSVSGGTDDEAATAVHVALDGKYAGLITLSDVAKEDAKEAISSLKKMGVKKTVMLTGDTKAVAEKVGAELGLDEVYSELLPNDKVERIEELLNKDGTVLFVGDGINDAPVLMRSDVGIAMGGMGSDAAIEAADVVIMDDKPSRVSEAIKSAKSTMSVVWQNVAFALGVKILIIALCSIGLANMWLAVFGDVGVTMIAVLNAMRPLMFAKKK